MFTVPHNGALSLQRALNSGGTHIDANYNNGSSYPGA